ncbi:kotsubu isoform 2-T2 [Cochliomyia hominivorax]
MDEIVCSKCEQTAQYKCERCLEPYCSSQCQVNDWQDHKSKCYKFPTGYNPRRSYGSTHNLNESRRSITPVNGVKPKPKKLLNDDDFNMVPKSTSSTSIVSVVKPLPERSNTWRVAFPPSVGFFEAIVQFKEEVESAKRIVWITDLKYESSLRKFLAEINRTINQNHPCSHDDIYEGALLAAPLDKMLYRVEVLENSPDVQKATVRLIDYGNEIRVNYTQLFAPIPIMCNLNAFAFRVCLPNDHSPLEIESIITIKILGEKQTGNYYNVECKMKSIPLHLPLDLISKQPLLKVVKCFPDGRNALLRLCEGDGINDLEFDNLLNSPQSLNFEFESVPKMGSFVAARTQSGWKRSRLLGFCEKQHQYLVYTLDEGVISMSPQIKRVPESFISHPIRVFAISTNSIDCMLYEAMLMTTNSLTLQLLPVTSSATNKDSKTQLACALFDGKRKLMEVMASVFTGSLSELGLKLWHECIPEGDTVIVSHVLTFKEIYITSQLNADYPQIIMGEYSKCVPFTSDELIKKMDIVVYFYNKHNSVLKYCRGEIVGFKGIDFKIKDIDSGSEQMVGRQNLRKPTLLVSSLPIRCRRAVLMFLVSIPLSIASNRALKALETCMENTVEFYVTYSDNNTVDLLFRTKEKQSLCKKLLPMLFEPEDNQASKSFPTLPENASVTLSPPTTPFTCQPSSKKPTETLDSVAIKQKVFTIDDLNVIPITCGERVPLYVLDQTTILNLESPYITAADFNNKDFFSKMEQYLRVVGEYCKSDKAPKNGYAPKKMEICLSVFAEDGEWYRALCIDHKPNDIFVVMFLDFGNTAKVNRKDIMPMVEDLMFPSNANMVYIEGITNKDQGISFIKNIQKNPIIYVNVSRLDEADAYLARICLS